MKKLSERIRVVILIAELCVVAQVACMCDMVMMFHVMLHPF